MTSITLNVHSYIVPKKQIDDLVSRWTQGKSDLYCVIVQLKCQRPNGKYYFRTLQKNSCLLLLFCGFDLPLRKRLRGPYVFTPLRYFVCSSLQAK